MRDVLIVLIILFPSITFQSWPTKPGATRCYPWIDMTPLLPVNHAKIIVTVRNYLENFIFPHVLEFTICEFQ